MKKGILLAVLVSFMSVAAYAQNYMVVDTEKVFNSVTAYTDANETIEQLGTQYQKTVDDAYAEIEKMFDSYMVQKPRLNDVARSAREKQILDREQEVLEYQEKIFGQEGELLKKRVELVKPIQDMVFDVIDKYAQAHEYDVVLDITNNPMVLYYSPNADKTEEIIKLVK